MKNFTFFSTAILLLTFFLCQHACLGQELAWKFTKGDTFNVSFEQDTSVSTTYKLIERKIGTRVELTMSWNVIDVSAENVATVEQTITDISITMTTPAQDGVKTIQVDSTKVGKSTPRVERNMWDQIKPLIGIQFEVQMFPNGKIGEVTTSEATMKLLREANGSMRLRELLTPASLRELFSQSVVEIPDGNLAEPWQVEKDSETDMGSFQSIQTFQVDGETEVEGKSLQRISSSMTTTQTPVEDEEANILQVASGSGELLFDAEAGHFTSSQSENQFTFQRKYRDGQIDTVTKSTVSMRISKTITKPGS